MLPYVLRDTLITRSDPATARQLLNDFGIAAGRKLCRHCVVTAAEDLDGLGLPVINECACTYDEGFIAGVFSKHTGWDVKGKKRACWRSGDTVRRLDKHVK